MRLGGGLAPVWFAPFTSIVRSLAAEGDRIYAAGGVGGSITFSRWQNDGTKVWAHVHNELVQVRSLGDLGSVHGRLQAAVWAR